jgi:hypothetical protein
MPDSGPLDTDQRRLNAFDEHRGLLFSIAYRMLGSVADAEDTLQETVVLKAMTVGIGGVPHAEEKAETENDECADHVGFEHLLDLRALGCFSHTIRRAWQHPKLQASPLERGSRARSAS